MIWVIDASVTIRWFLVEEADETGNSVLREVIDKPEMFAVPELFAFEVLAVLSRTHPRGVSIFRESVLPLLSGGILRYPMIESLVRQTEQFLSLGLTGYDACYAGLARELHGFWLTYDRKAHKKIRRQGVSHLLSDGLPPDWP